MNAKHARVLVALMSAFIALVAVFASSASAREPAPGYSQFAGCPSPEEVPNIEFCVASTITGGHFQMGSKDVPIKNPMKLSGGVTNENHFVYNSKGGLTPVKQLVPGGIIGLTGLDWLVNFLSLEDLKLYAVTELAGTPGNPLFDIPYVLPVKIHLINPALGQTCYVGSNSNPITLNLTVDTTNPPPPNEPITGHPPQLELVPGYPELFRATNGEFVDNAFAAPGATGCRIELGLINIGVNSLVNSQSGLPAPAGTNETRQTFDADATFVKYIYP
jgi:hypothetical protein